MRHGPLHDGHMSSARRRDLTRLRSENTNASRTTAAMRQVLFFVSRLAGVITESAHLLAESERIIRIQRVLIRRPVAPSSQARRCYDPSSAQAHDHLRTETRD